ncbi:MAG: hypothetical protein GX956_03235 [Firmicutes bacterium]|mgnify:CR=1 FL=1|nr:hypothetical protein [Bacillota bacterium]
MPEKKQTNKKKKGVQSLEQQLENTRERNLIPILSGLIAKELANSWCEIPLN